MKSIILKTIMISSVISILVGCSSETTQNSKYDVIENIEILEEQKDQDFGEYAYDLCNNIKVMYNKTVWLPQRSFMNQEFELHEQEVYEENKSAMIKIKSIEDLIEEISIEDIKMINEDIFEMNKPIATEILESSIYTINGNPVHYFEIEQLMTEEALDKAIEDGIILEEQIKSVQGGRDAILSVEYASNIDMTAVFGDKIITYTGVILDPSDREKVIDALTLIMQSLEIEEEVSEIETTEE